MIARIVTAFALLTLSPFVLMQSASAQTNPDDVHWDDGFYPPGLDGYVYDLTYGPDGRLYAGGSFEFADGVGANRVAVWDGTSWSALGDGVNHTVYTLAVDDAGNVYAGGRFTEADGVPVNHVAKWDGTSWSPLGGGVNHWVYALAVEGTTLYAGGRFTEAGSSPASRMAMWDGTNWASLGAGTNGDVTTLAIDSQGDLYAGGYFSEAGGTPVHYIARWDGSWHPLGAGLNNDVEVLLVDESDNLYVGGEFDQGDNDPGVVTISRVGKWDGSNWSALGTGLGEFNDVVEALAIGPDGTLYAGGDFGMENPTFDNLAQWDGTNWTGVDDGLDRTVEAIAINGTQIHAGGGNFSAFGSIAVDFLAVWNGAEWSALTAGGSGLNGGASAFASIGTDLYVGGSFEAAGGRLMNGIAKWDGSDWSALGSGIRSYVYTLAVDGAGNVYAGGFIYEAGGTPVNSIAKWDGSTWSALGSGVNSSVNALVTDDNNNLYAGGYFTEAGGSPASRIAKWDGSSWSEVGGGVNSGVLALATDSDGNLYAGGGFTDAGGTSVNNVAKWDGTSWSALGSGVNGTVQALAVDAAGNVYAGGNFTQAGGQTAWRVAMWNGSEWAPLGLGVNDYVKDLALDGAGNLILTGGFTYAWDGSTSMPVSYVAGWTGTTFIPLGTGVDDDAGALYVMDTDLFVGGIFEKAGQKASARIARWDLNSAPLPVELASFAAVLDGDAVRLEWQTATETNNAGFKVERRSAQTEIWESVGFVEGFGTTSAPQRYHFTDGDLPFGVEALIYRLKQVDLDGAFEYSPEVEVALAVPEVFALEPVFPNPSHSTATLRFALPQAGPVRLALYDVLGREVAVLVDEARPAGRHEFAFNARRLPSGLYFVRLISDDGARTQKLTVVR